MPCNFHLRALAKQVKEGIRAAGGTPMEFNTIAISDGITMGTSGHEDEPRLAARSSPTRSSWSRAATSSTPSSALCGCDKTIPGTVMALARLDVPGVMLYGGSIPPGHYKGEDITIMEVFEAVGAHAAGKITDEELAEIEAAASPGAGACGGQFTANTMAMAFEMLGISPIGPSPRPRAGRDQGRRSPTRPASWSWTSCSRGLRPSDIITRESLENAILARRRQRRLDQRRAAPARGRPRDGRRARHRRLRPRSPSPRRCLCDLKPGGRYVATDLHAAGGTAVARQAPEGGRPAARGRAHGHRARRSASSPTRPTRAEGQEVIRPLDNPLKPTGGLAILRGNLAPEGCVVKLSGHERRLPQRPGARVRGRGGGDGRRHQRPDQPRRRRRHPQRGPRRRPRHARDARRHRRRSSARASATASR